MRLYQYVSILACKCDLIEEDLLDQGTDYSGKHEISDTPGTKSNPTTTAVSCYELVACEIFLVAFTLCLSSIGLLVSQSMCFPLQ